MAMHMAATEKTPHCLDTATYGKPVEIRVTENRGRGLFSMKDIVAGDLLLCEKAFSYSFLDNPSTTSLANENAFKGTNRALLNLYDTSTAPRPFVLPDPGVSLSRDIQAG